MIYVKFYGQKLNTRLNYLKAQMQHIEDCLDDQPNQDWEENAAEHEEDEVSKQRLDAVSNTPFVRIAYGGKISIGLLKSIEFYTILLYYTKRKEMIMGISIKNPEVERLARKIAVDESISLTEAIKRALKAYQKTGDMVSAEVRERRKKAIRKFQEACAARPIDYSLSNDEILGYDENGLPT